MPRPASGSFGFPWSTIREDMIAKCDPRPDKAALAVVAMNLVHPERAWKTGGCPPSAPKPEPRRNIQKNTRTPQSRLPMVRRVLEQRQPATEVGADFGVSERTVRKWLARWRAGGEPAEFEESVAMSASPD
jgi:hypothetical protein